ncbi:MAG: N-acetylmuramoyl-L-alanine amidase family protein [Planctomycetota bacterium]|jgi:N-acetylmuramoyl-L-alanine amidase
MLEIVGSIERPVYKTTLPEKAEPVPVPRLTGKVIIVDPGHGGKDPGAGEVGYSRLSEKSIVLAVAKEVETQLKACGAQVVMTRTADYFVPLDDRAAIADVYKADLLVSIHADSFPEEHMNGPTVYIANKASHQSRKVANSIHSSFSSVGIVSNGVRRNDFRVLAKHSKPAVLVECGYLTNRKEAEKLNAAWYRARIARLITDGTVSAVGER